MDELRDSLVIDVEYITHDGEYGSYFVASCDDIGLATDGPMFNDLLRNLKEALSPILDHDEVRGHFKVVAEPRITLKITLPPDFVGSN